MNVKLAYIIGILVVLIACGFVVGAAKPQSGSAPHETAQTAMNPSAGPKKAEEQFKNIQVLKGVPAEQIFPTMQFISASLGVECEFCHVQNAFEKDDKKPKQTARQMIQMQLAINRDNFKGEREVTCYSCHHGSEHPAAIPIIADEEPKRQIPQDAAAM